MGQMNAVVKKLGGYHGALRFLKDKTKVVEVNPVTPRIITIKLGTGLRSADDFRQAIVQAGMKFSESCDIISKPEFERSVIPQETEVDLAVLSLSELGFESGETLEEIYRKAKELGLELCPAEVGPQLRLQYKNQPRNEKLNIAMDPIGSWTGCTQVFMVGCVWNGPEKDKQYLTQQDSKGGPGNYWDLTDEFVFIRPRK